MFFHKNTSSRNHLDILDISDQPVFPIQSKSYYFTPIQSNLDYCKLSKPEVPYCQNHIKFITKKKDDILFVCGTNADAPKGFEINTTSGVTTYGSDDKFSAVPCSNDPFHNFTAIYINTASFFTFKSKMKETLFMLEEEEGGVD
ncbi:unnamed protein product [Mytilus coruscus]|uniref:Uncharacterized protein n=1 Tax=Mytilus coruscus TaxID=42192 RepID=A0A6J8D9V7_MYTCO|nr:unnamed protein product [Mytilus coruscus]